MCCWFHFGVDHAVALLKSRRHLPLGHFYLPPVYTGEWRCDTHPCASRDGKRVVIDSPHGGNGRQLYLIDIRELIV